MLHSQPMAWCQRLIPTVTSVWTVATRFSYVPGRRTVSQVGLGNTYVLAKKAEDQRKENKEAEARQKAIAGLRDFAGNWICFPK